MEWIQFLEMLLFNEGHGVTAVSRTNRGAPCCRISLCREAKRKVNVK